MKKFQKFLLLDRSCCSSPYGLGNVCLKGNFMGAFTPFWMPTKQTFNRKLKNRNQAIDLPIEVDIL